MSQGKAREYSCQNDLPFLGSYALGQKSKLHRRERVPCGLLKEEKTLAVPGLATLLDAWRLVCVRT